MNREFVDRLAKALLYEGYVLYPYRPSVKNSQRWTFGGVYPRAWAEAQTGTDSNVMQTECLMSGGEQTRVRVIVRFLHLRDRQVGELALALDALPPDSNPDFRRVQFLQIGSESYQSWQEAEEREIDLGDLSLAGLMLQGHRKEFNYAGRRTTEPLRDVDNKIVALLIREQHGINGAVEVSAARMTDNLFKLQVRVVNEVAEGDLGNRDAALLHSLISTHTILGVEQGELVSLTDPPDNWRAYPKQCRNIGCWPVLVGVEPARDTLLASPIILCDYPELAPESPGDLFDSTEIDEILTLRILTLTDDEKRAAAGVDSRVRELMARTESVARDHLMNLHGTIRGMRNVSQEQSHG